MMTRSFNFENVVPFCRTKERPIAPALNDKLNRILIEAQTTALDEHSAKAVKDSMGGSGGNIDGSAGRLARDVFAISKTLGHQDLATTKLAGDMWG